MRRARRSCVADPRSRSPPPTGESHFHPVCLTVRFLPRHLNARALLLARGDTSNRSHDNLPSINAASILCNISYTSVSLLSAIGLYIASYASFCLRYTSELYERMVWQFARDVHRSSIRFSIPYLVTDGFGILRRYAYTSALRFYREIQQAFTNFHLRNTLR